METQAELDPSSVTSLVEHWSQLSGDDRKTYFRQLPRTDAEELFLNLTPSDQYDLILEMANLERRSWIRILAPDDAADLIQLFPVEQRADLLNLLDELTRKEVMGLLAYAEDNAGGLMNPRYVRLRADMTVEEAIRYIRAQARNPIEIIYYAYVQDSLQQLLGVVSFRDLFLAPPNKLVRDIMITDLISVQEDMDQEEVSRLFSQHELLAMPVLDKEGRMKGIVTMDDIVGVVQEEATEDIQKLGGTQALEAPYLKIGVLEMLRKRGVWLIILFLGEGFTATAMGHYLSELERVVVLTMFIPLIISSGGNSGSQASTLMIRALALEEIQLRDWWRVLISEIRTGAVLGLLLGGIGFLRVVLWPWKNNDAYKEHYILIGVTVGGAVMGCVLWGAISGSMLPFVLRKLGLDPATASAPFVATLVDVTGLLIYFSVASAILSGTLL